MHRCAKVQSGRVSYNTREMQSTSILPMLTTELRNPIATPLPVPGQKLQAKEPSEEVELSLPLIPTIKLPNDSENNSDPETRRYSAGRRQN
jgi:hypothetical protein